MAQFHFVEDYERLVASLKAQYPIDEAMDRAVGGKRQKMGAIQLQLLTELGLNGATSLVDLGCGSGRTAEAIGMRFPNVSYLGTDIVQDLLDYAITRCPAHFKFVRHRELTIPAGDGTADMVCAFSLFTHLLPEETYCYLEEARRVLKPGGCIVFSFLEFASPNHWAVFSNTVALCKAGTPHHLNMFLERGAISKFATELSFEVEKFIFNHPLGQSACLLRKP